MDAPPDENISLTTGRHLAIGTSPLVLVQPVPWRDFGKTAACGECKRVP